MVIQCFKKLILTNLIITEFKKSKVWMIITIYEIKRVVQKI